RIHTLIARERIPRDTGTADPMRAVATRDEVTVDVMLDAMMSIGDSRAGCVNAVKSYILSLIDRVTPGGFAGKHQIARDLGLTIHDHTAANQVAKIHPMPRACEGDFDAVVNEGFMPQTLAGTGGIEQLDGTGLDDARANAAEHVLTCLPLEHDIGDALLQEELPQQETGGSRADDHDLGTHLELRQARAPACTMYGSSVEMDSCASDRPI